MSVDFGKWLERKFCESGLKFFYDFDINVKELGDLVADMSRAEMAVMRTYFRKQRGLRLKEVKKE
ncbi:MAG TPA: hypothetical protein VMW25_04380 [Clostridia bacterium]|nr:hypothetical protein [Clostridia bacterium]